MATFFHDGFCMFGKLGTRPMNFHPDFKAGIRSGLSALAERFADLSQGFFNRHFFGQPIGPNFYPFAAH